MKFLTEADLRDAYRAEPFTTYVLPAGARLTPGARQFLNDRGIRLPVPGKPAKPVPAEAPRPSEDGCEQWRLKLRTLQAEFLQAGCELLTTDVATAEGILNLEWYLAELNRTSPDPERILTELGAGSAEEQERARAFELTGFHVQTQAGRSAVRLNLLRCRLRELIPQLPQSRQKTAQSIAGRLDQMIYRLFGGTPCQQK